ncbi:hypothetical protein N8600_11545, partial [Gammaproteobacteria bacterium]|nr:hypothetical protein [Gammaproteobacteria bacterium]
NEPLINYALAKLTRSHNVAKFIYDNGDQRLRESILSGPIVNDMMPDNWIYNVFKQLVKDNDFSSLSILLANEKTPENLLKDYLCRQHHWQAIDDEIWVYLLRSFVKNGMLCFGRQRFSSESKNGENLNQLSWKLFECIELSRLTDNSRKSVLKTLSELAETLKESMLASSYDDYRVQPFFNRDAVCAKWDAIKDESNNSEFDESVYIYEITNVMDWLCKAKDPTYFREEQDELYSVEEYAEASFTNQFKQEISESLLSNKTIFEEIRSYIDLSKESLSISEKNIFTLNLKLEEMAKKNELFQKITFILFAVLIGVIFLNLA